VVGGGGPAAFLALPALLAGAVARATSASLRFRNSATKVDTPDKNSVCVLIVLQNECYVGTKAGDTHHQTKLLIGRPSCSL